MPRYAGAVLGMVFLAHAASAQFVQQGSLVGTGVAGAARMGASVAISGDGNTAIVGGPTDNGATGAAWIFTRSAGVWSQQGTKLVGAGAVGAAQQGRSVAISADGNTAIVGGPEDGSQVGAAWVFTRSGDVWSQQGGKLLGTDVKGPARQGASVAISADGNTAVVGGPWDQSAITPDYGVSVGAAWVFSRSGGAWAQQGGKLVGTDASYAAQGTSVAISGDGSTAVIGGPRDPFGATPDYSVSVGAAWVFTRSGDVWSQQGGKLVGTGAVGYAEQGTSVGISGDGNTAIVGGPGDQTVVTPDYGLSVGAAWVYTRSGGVWSQQGGKLVGTDAVYAAQGTAVALSADGNAAVIGGPGPWSSTNAAWVFARNGVVWSQRGSKLGGDDAAGTAGLGASVAISGDGTTVIVGGPGDADNSGAAWVFSAPAFTAWVPVASHTGGLNNSQWRSDLGLLNTGAVTANVQIMFYGTGSVVSSTTYVPPGVQSVLTDLVGQIGASGSGAIKVLSDQPLKITTRTYNQVPSGASCYPNGTQGQAYPVVASGDGLGAGQSAYLAGLTENASYRCNIGVVNTGTEGATVLVELFDGAGRNLASYTVSLAAGQWVQPAQPFLNVAGQTAMDRGYAKITVQSGSGVFAFASVIDNITNDPTPVTMQR